MYLILLPHTPALFMMSQTQTAGHKMAALTVTFLWLSWFDFNKLDLKASGKLLCVHFVFFIISIPTDRTQDVSLLWLTVLCPCISLSISSGSTSLTDNKLGVAGSVHGADHVSGQHVVGLVPLDHQCLVVAPVDAHVAEGLPQGRWGKALVAGHQPDAKQHAQHSLTQVVTDVICPRNKHWMSDCACMYATNTSAWNPFQTLCKFTLSYRFSVSNAFKIGLNWTTVRRMPYLNHEDKMNPSSETCDFGRKEEERSTQTKRYPWNKPVRQS